MSDLESQGNYVDDPQFDSLADRLADDIFEITASNGRLWALLRSSNLDAAVELASENRSKFRTLKSDIERLQKWPDTTPAQRYTQHKIVREFSDAFKEFQRIQKDLAANERQAIAAARSSESKGNTRNGAASAALVDDGSSTGGGIELEQQLAFDEQLRQDEVAYQQGLIEEREHEIQGIEQGISELNEIFTNLHTVVTEQGTVLDNIEANIYSTSQNVRDGAGQLTKAARWQKRSSGRNLCFLMMLLVFALVIIVSVLA